MKFLTQMWRGRTLTVAAAVGAAFATGAAAQADEALVPFIVNVNATVSATDGVTQRQVTVTANQETLLRLPLQNANGVLNGAQSRLSVPAVINNHAGKVTVNLSAQTYKNAELSLYTVNGKRILHYKASASSAVNNISRRNITTGVYLLSVRGANGVAVTSRMTHSGGGLDISVVFSGENSPSASRLAKKATSEDWMITVSAAGYVDSVYTLRPVAGINPTQNITLQKASSGGSDFVLIGGLKWMTKNLNVETADSWCYGEGGQAFDVNRAAYVTLTPSQVQANCNTYGRLYTWSAAKAACQSVGMRLPTRKDWDDLSDLVDGTGQKVNWNNENGNGTNETGFSALPGGYRDSDGYFSNVGNDGSWWTATENGSNAYYRGMYYDHGIVYVPEGNRDKSYGFSARCVQD